MSFRSHVGAKVSGAEMSDTQSGGGTKETEVATVALVYS